MLTILKEAEEYANLQNAVMQHIENLELTEYSFYNEKTITIIVAQSEKSTDGKQLFNVDFQYPDKVVVYLNCDVKAAAKHICDRLNFKAGTNMINYLQRKNKR